MVSESNKGSKISFKECLTLIRFYFYYTITKMQHQNYKKIYISKLFLCQRVKDILFDILVVKALSCKAMTKFYCKGMHCNHGQDTSRGITSQQKSGRDMSGLGWNGRSRHIPNFGIKNWGDLGFSLIFPAFSAKNTGKSRVNLNFSKFA